MIVDDDRDSAYMLESALSEDFNVVCCTSGRKALDLVRTGEFDVVCADYEMPGVDGIQVLHAAAAARPGTGCVLLTGSEDCPSSGGNSGYYLLTKPFDPARLTRILLELAALSDLRGGPAPGNGSRRPPP
jgi:CheY-like chemotaxis protein